MIEMAETASTSTAISSQKKLVSWMLAITQNNLEVDSIIICYREQLMFTEPKRDQEEYLFLDHKRSYYHM